MLACLEICLKTIKENDSQPEMFLLLLNFLKMVCYEKVNANYAFIKFVLESLKILGYYVEISKCSACGNKIENKQVGFSFEYNGIVCSKCQKSILGLELTPGEYSILKFINETESGELSRLKFLSRDDLTSVTSILIKDFKILTDIDIESIKKFL